MSLVDNKGTKLFPAAFVAECVAVYEGEHGYSPKTLVVNPDDLIDWCLSSFGGKRPTEIMGMQVLTGSYLEPGQLDLAAGVIESE